MAIVVLWFFVDVPLALAGGYLGVKKGVCCGHPTRQQCRSADKSVFSFSLSVTQFGSIKSLDRFLPSSGGFVLGPQRSLPDCSPSVCLLIFRVLPASGSDVGLTTGAAFIESYFIMQSLFGAKAFYAFGFLALTSVVVALTVATTTILMCYFHLCAEEYRWASFFARRSSCSDPISCRWHWRSFLAGGGSAFWLLAYGLLYWATRLKLDGLANKVLYVGYLLLISLMCFMITGAIGFCSTYGFLRVI